MNLMRRALIAFLALPAAVAPAAPEPSSPLLSINRVEQTPFFSRATEGLRQNLQVTVVNAGPARDVLASARCGETAVTGTLSLAMGENRLDLPAPAVDAPTSVVITLSADGHETVHADTLFPQRRWKLYIVPGIHTDIGYTDTQEAVFRRFNANLDTVIELCRRNPLFKWNIEVAWELQNYMASRPDTSIQALLRLIEEGRVGLHAGYLNELTALLSDEAMNRVIYYATDLRRRYGMDTSSAILTDVPSATWSVPSMLAASGVRFFAQGSNQTRAPLLRNTGIRPPFYWEGPDGARVLMWINESYAQSLWLAHSRNLSELQTHVRNFLRPFERGDYPYDAVYVYGAFFDNAPLDMRYGELLDDWNGKWAYPRLILSTSTAFADYMEANWRDRIPVLRGDFGAFWEDGAASSAHETTLHLNSQRRATAAETLWALARLAGAPNAFPADRARKVWENLLFYAEHTWGAAQSIADPDSTMTLRQWEGKAKYAHDADRDSRLLLAEGLEAFVRTVPAKEGEVVVVNTQSWERSGLVELPGEAGAETGVQDSEGRIVPSQVIDGRLVFYAEKVPGFGSRVYRKCPPASTPAPPVFEPGGVKNRFYRIRVDETRGITGITDLDSGTELVDDSAPFTFGQVLYAAGGEDTTLVMDNAPRRPELVLNAPGEAAESPEHPAGRLTVTPARVTRIEAGQVGPVCSEIVIHSSAPALPEIRTHVRLYHTEKRIGIDVRMTSKTEIRRKEAVYVAFPFAAQEPRFRLGMTNAVARPDRDFFRGACREWYCVQDFVACGGSSPSGTAASAGRPDVVWTSLDAPLITLGQINTGRWSPEPAPTTATLFSYVMNNYWFTNYKAGQGGDFRFRYELKSGTLDNGECLRFSRGVATPLLAAVSPGVAEAGTAPSGPALGLESDDVIATTLKPSEDGHGVIVRLRNTRENSATASLRLPDIKGARAERLNLVEERLEPLDAPGGTVRMAFKPQQTVTVGLAGDGL